MQVAVGLTPVGRGEGCILIGNKYIGGVGAPLVYSKYLNNRQTLAGFVDNYDLIYKILQKH